MRRGTTACQAFAVPRDISAAKVYVTWKQHENVILEKSNDELIFEDGWIIAELSQEETLMFEEGAAKVQIRYVEKDGFADGSKEMGFKVKGILKEGVIKYED